MARKLDHEDKRADATDTTKYDFIKKIDTPTLETMIRQMSSEDGDFDADMVSQIVSILVQRKDPTPKEEIEQSLSEFKAKFLSNTTPVPNRTKRRPNRYKGLIAAACVCFVLVGSLGIVQATGVDILSFFLSFGQSSTVIRNQEGDAGIDKPISEKMKSQSASNDMAILNEHEPVTIDDAVKAFGHEIPFPTIPDGFIFDNVYVESTSRSKKLLIKYQREDQVLSYSVTYGAITERIYENNPSADPSPYDYIYYSEGVPCYIATNIDENKATWLAGDIQLMIYGNITEGELKNMIDSIYGGKPR